MDNSAVVIAGSETSCDGFLDGRVRAYQPRKGPRAAIDALFMAAAIPAIEGEGQHVLEAGAGSGVASLALAARVADVRITGVEIQPDLCEMARRNVSLNAMEDHIRVIEADVTGGAEAMKRAKIEAASFDHVAANPPFLNTRNARVSPDASVARAHSVGDGELASWIGFLDRMVRPKGSLTLIHRADALPELLAHLGSRFGGLTVFPLFPREGEPANRVIIQGTKSSRAPLVLNRGLVIHEPDGSYARQANAVLRQARSLDIGENCVR